jgi:hypothetical protein
LLTDENISHAVYRLIEELWQLTDYDINFDLSLELKFTDFDEESKPMISFVPIDKDNNNS